MLPFLQHDINKSTWVEPYHGMMIINAGLSLQSLSGINVFRQSHKATESNLSDSLMNLNDWKLNGNELQFYCFIVLIWFPNIRLYALLISLWYFDNDHLLDRWERAMPFMSKKRLHSVAPLLTIFLNWNWIRGICVYPINNLKPSKYLFLLLALFLLLSKLHTKTLIKKKNQRLLPYSSSPHQITYLLSYVTFPRSSDDNRHRIMTAEWYEFVSLIHPDDISKSMISGEGDREFTGFWQKIWPTINIDEDNI